MSLSLGRFARPVGPIFFSLPMLKAVLYKLSHTFALQKNREKIIHYLQKKTEGKIKHIRNKTIFYPASQFVGVPGVKNETI